MSEKTTLTPKHYQAAQLVAEDELTDLDIAAQVGITDRTLRRWKDDDAFNERVEEVRQKIRQHVLAHGIARWDRRMRAMNDRWERMQALIDQRSQKELVTQRGGIVPGWDTGLVIMQTTQGGVTFTVDSQLLSEMRQLEKQAAQEAGQWLDRAESQQTVTHETKVTHEVRFDHDGYRRLFRDFYGGTHPAPPNDPQQSLDTAHPDA